LKHTFTKIKHSKRDESNLNQTHFIKELTTLMKTLKLQTKRENKGNLFLKMPKIQSQKAIRHQQASSSFLITDLNEPRHHPMLVKT
jgi:hypothetical protein